MVVSIVLGIINVYGLTQSMNQDDISSEYLRFGDRDKLISSEQLSSGINKLRDESDAEFAKRITKLIADGISHIHWEDYEPEKFHQQVPLWENWILWAMGEFSGIPEFEKYHFTQIDKSIERGIGLCGDVSMLLSEILRVNGIANQIITAPGHVIVEAIDDGLVLDPDFGVYIEAPFIVINKKPELTKTAYSSAGYPDDGVYLSEWYLGDFTRWDGAMHFVTQKYYFERFSYVAIWMIPILLLFISLWLRKINANYFTAQRNFSAD